MEEYIILEVLEIPPMTDPFVHAFLSFHSTFDKQIKL